MSSAPKPIAELIAVLRQQKGLTQEAFAAAVGVSRSFVAQWESGRGGEIPHLTGIAAALDVPVEVFLNGMSCTVYREAVTSDELTLLDIYRRCSVPQRIAIANLASNLRQSELDNESFGAAGT